MSPSSRSPLLPGRRARPAAALLAGAALLVGALLVGSFLFLPRQLGGSATYVVTDGTSMTPGIGDGELVIARRAPSYGEGDVVAYRSGALGRTVLHRIVGGDEDGFVVKGDANDWLDPDQPTEAEVLGRLWLRIPVAGRLLEALLGPAGVALAGAVALGGAGAGGAHHRRRARIRRPPTPAPRSTTMTMTTLRSRTGWRQAAAALAALALGVGGLAALAWSRPLVERDGVALSFTHRGELTYRAEAAGSLVYDDGTADTGEPVFLRLADEVDMRFRYRAEGLDTAASGELVLGARLAGSSGWRHPLDLATSAPVEDGAAVARLTVRPTELHQLADRIDEEVGGASGGRTLTLVATVTLDGGEAPVAPFATEVTFRLGQVSVEQADPAAEPGTPTVLTEPATVTRPQMVPTELSLPGRDLPVGLVRVVATVLAIAAAVAAAVALAVAHRLRPAPGDETAGYADRLVAATTVTSGDLPTVDVDRFADLAAVAERADRLILHVAGKGEYLVHDDTALYRYAPARPEDTTRAGSPAASPTRSPGERTLDALDTLGAGWHVVRGGGLAPFDLDAVAVGPGGVLGVTTLALDGEPAGPRCGPGRAAAERTRAGVRRLEAALGDRAAVRVVPTLVFWDGDGGSSADSTVVDGVFLLNGHQTEQWRCQLDHPNLPDTTVAAVATAVGELATADVATTTAGR